MALPIILYGAFDRHNFGDLLLAQVTAAMLPGRVLEFAGLADRDLRAYGGFRVRALPRLLSGRPPRSVHLLHVGGETLTCDAWSAAAMLLDPADALATIGYLEARPAERDEWVRRLLGVDARLPYLVSNQRWPALAQVVVNAAGGVGIGRLDAACLAELHTSLTAASLASARDRTTRTWLDAQGIALPLMPDPAVMIEVLFGKRVREQARSGAVAAIRQMLPQGYLALQFGAEFGDDATLDRLASQLSEAARSLGYGVVLFRAGAAPWHDDRSSLPRLASRLRAESVQVFDSLDLWDIAALVASARAYCGSSLHGRIVAMAFGVPRVGLAEPGSAGQAGKQAAFAATWDEAMPAGVQIDDLANQIRRVVEQPASAEPAASLAERFERSFGFVRESLD